MNAQEIFDATVEHLRGMTERAAVEEAHSTGYALRCAYLAPDGSQCAIGFRIPEGHNGLDFTGRVRNLIGRYPDLYPVLMPSDMDQETGFNFLTRLQRAHDTATHWSLTGLNEKGWNYLRKIAEQHRLRYE